MTGLPTLRDTRKIPFPPCAFLPLLICSALLCGSVGAGAQDACDRLLPHARTDAALLRATGERLSAAHRYTCAVEALTQASALEPGNARGEYLLGLSLYQSGRLERAANVLKHAAALDEASVPVHLALGGVEHDLHHPAAALLEWERVLELDPGSVTALDWIAKGRLEAGQYTAAIDLLGSAPRDETLELDLVVAYGREGLEEEAITEAQRALAAHPDWWRLQAALAVLYAQRNRFQEALGVLDTILRHDPDDSEAHLQRLRILILSGDLEAALPAAEQYAGTHPHTFDALYPLGLVHREGGLYDQAHRELEEAAALNPKSYDVRLNLGMTLIKLQRFSEAKAQLDQALALNDEAPEVHFQQAAALRGLGRVDDARAESDIFQRCLKQRATHDQQVNLGAQAAQKLRDHQPQEAAELYRQMLAADPENGLTFYNLSLALEQAGDMDGEAQALQSAVQRRPDLAVAQNRLGDLLAAAGKAKDAELCFRKAIAAVPQYAEAESNLGSLLAGEGRTEEAEHLLRDALAANPRYEDAWINLGATLAEESRFKEARAAAEHALQVNPSSPAAREMLAALPAFAAAGAP